MKKSSMNYLLLWQGNAVSIFGEALYNVALGLWIYDKTGSAAIMGTIIAVAKLPIIILGPFGGVLADRLDRKKLIVLGDLLRGIGMLVVAALGLFGDLEVWMVMCLGILLSICATFFNPSMQSILPDIVSKEKLVKASSKFQIGTQGANIIGNAIGGLIYIKFGFLALVFANGVSYVISAFTECFIKVQKNIDLMGEVKKNSFFEEFKDGVKYVMDNKALSRIILFALSVNFFSGMTMTSLNPFFILSPHLGREAYGLMSAFMSGGMLIGGLLLSVVTIKDSNKYKVFIFSTFTFEASLIIGALIERKIPIFGFFMFGSIFLMAVNTILNTSTLMAVPENMRGKVMSVVSAVAMAMSPLGNALGGVLSDIVQPKTVILSSGVVWLVAAFIIVVNPLVKSFFNGDEEEVVVE
ncbi:MAG: MFS transporter [Clostridioides sp.]|jgi:MFS family permease|nr:MFS transporter [Clostridioides sp.]